MGLLGHVKTRNALRLLEQNLGVQLQTTEQARWQAFPFSHSQALQLFGS